MIEAFTARLELELNRADFLLFISRHSPALSLGLHSPTTAPNQTHRALFLFVISRPGSVPSSRAGPGMARPPRRARDGDAAEVSRDRTRARIRKLRICGAGFASQRISLREITLPKNPKFCEHERPGTSLRSASILLARNARTSLRSRVRRVPFSGRRRRSRWSSSPTCQIWTGECDV